MLGLCIVPRAFSAAQTVPEIDYRATTEAYARLNYEAFEAIRSAKRAESNSERIQHISYLRALTIRGSALAAFELGYAHLLGLEGVEIDEQQGVALIEQAASEGEPFALLAYGLMLLSGEHVDPDVARGSRLIIRAAELGNPAARVVLVDQIAGIEAELSASQRLAWRESLGYNSGEVSPNGQHHEEIQGQNLANGRALIAHFYRTGTFVNQDTEFAAELSGRIAIEWRANARAGLAYTIAKSHHMWSDQRAARLYFESLIDGAPPQVINNYAWLLATAIDPVVRDGDRAVEIMKELLKGEPESAGWVDTLAAAYAEAGQFEQAVVTQDHAIQLFKEGGAVPPAANARRELYLGGKPWRD